jgi:hypothetical protein
MFFQCLDEKKFNLQENINIVCFQKKKKRVNYEHVCFLQQSFRSTQSFFFARNFNTKATTDFLRFKLLGWFESLLFFPAFSSTPLRRFLGFKVFFSFDFAIMRVACFFLLATLKSPLKLLFPEKKAKKSREVMLARPKKRTASQHSTVYF